MLSVGIKREYMNSRILSIEGPDGLGKSTQASAIIEILRNNGKRATIVKLPRYDYLTGKIILKMLKSGSALTWPNVFQVVQWLDKVIFQLFFLPKLLKENDYLIFDRWHISMWAYGLAGGASERLTNIFVNSLVKPNQTFIFCGKSKRDIKQDSYESNVKYQKRVGMHYVLWACAHDDAIVVDADQTKEQITEMMMDYIQNP
jgi:thymidylate kinase